MVVGGRKCQGGEGLRGEKVCKPYFQDRVGFQLMIMQPSLNAIAIILAVANFVQACMIQRAKIFKKLH